MLDAYIIDQIKRQEEERRREQDRPTIQIPLLPPEPKREKPDRRDDEDDSPRGVIIIDL